MGLCCTMEVAHGQEHAQTPDASSVVVCCSACIITDCLPASHTMAVPMPVPMPRPAPHRVLTAHKRQRLPGADGAERPARNVATHEDGGVVMYHQLARRYQGWDRQRRWWDGGTGSCEKAEKTAACMPLHGSTAAAPVTPPYSTPPPLPPRALGRRAVPFVYATVYLTILLLPAVFHITAVEALMQVGRVGGGWRVGLAGRGAGRSWGSVGRPPGRLPGGGEDGLPLPRCRWSPYASRSPSAPPLRLHALPRPCLPLPPTSPHLLPPPPLRAQLFPAQHVPSLLLAGLVVLLVVVALAQAQSLGQASGWLRCTAGATTAAP